jgi:hypothetical protein
MHIQHREITDKVILVRSPHAGEYRANQRFTPITHHLGRFFDNKSRFRVDRF